MSNPSGTEGHRERRPDDDDQSDPQAEVDHDPITEVIDIPAGSVPPGSLSGTDERRYTAPGFDAGCTQIIDRLPDDETEFIAAPTQSFASSPRVRAVAPQAIPPAAPRRPSWLIPILLLLGAVVAAAVVGLLLMKRAHAAQAAREEAVRSAIKTFDAAVRKGDLTTLRSVTCGQTQQTYVNYDDKMWADTYARVSEAKQYPVVASVDEVVVNGDHAEANVTSYMAFDPDTKSTRSFDLQFRDQQWRICQSA